MKKRFTTTLWLGVLTAGSIFLAAFSLKPGVAGVDHLFIPRSDNKLRKVAFEILDAKCNTCHRKKNPFMVFNEKNMGKRAPKIYKTVFIERRMPRGNEIRLTNDEYVKLEQWLFTQDIF